MSSVSFDDFAHALTACGAADVSSIAVAVSGGGDSMALAALLQQYMRKAGGKVLALTVDHGLRAGSAAEAVQTGAALALRGIEHRILKWEGEKPCTGIQQHARAARYAILAEACRAEGIGTLALGHNLEDQMETFWMRLAHGSGVDGLAGMAAVREDAGLRMIRPVLGFSRAVLRETCKAFDLPWVEDPSNENEKFLRVRLRGFEDVLAEEGLSPERLTRTLQKLEEAREALEFFAAKAFEDCVTLHAAGYALLDLAAWRELPKDVRGRVLSAALQAVLPQDYTAGAEGLELLQAALLQEGFAGRTLAGCEVFPQGDAIGICREAFGADVLGESGLRELKEKQANLPAIEALPFKVRRALRAVRQDGRLVAVPYAGWQDKEQA